MTVFVGTSGWQYRHWRDTFYPKGVAQNRWLEYYAQYFDTVELNVTSYRQPSPSTFEGWAERTPDSFVFAAKASRYLTHIAALCLVDTPRRRSPVWRTTNWTYARFHEGRATPHPCYGRAALATWATRLAEQWVTDDDVYAYFNNDGRACALRDARVFARACAQAGLQPSRVPPSRAVRGAR